MRQKSPTPKEIEVLQAIAVHGTIAAAARSLYVSPHTVDAHLDRLRDKSGCRYLTQMIAWAAANGWLLPLMRSPNLHSEKGFAAREDGKL